MRFHHRAVPIVLAAVLIDTIGFGIVLPVLLVFSALLITLFGVVPRLRPAPAPALASE